MDRVRVTTKKPEKKKQSSRGLSGPVRYVRMKPDDDRAIMAAFDNATSDVDHIRLAIEGFISASHVIGANIKAFTRVVLTAVHDDEERNKQLQALTAIAVAHQNMTQHERKKQQ